MRIILSDQILQQGITVAGTEEAQSQPCTLLEPSPARGTTSTRDTNNTTTTTTTTTSTPPQVRQNGSNTNIILRALNAIKQSNCFVIESNKHERFRASIDSFNVFQNSFVLSSYNYILSKNPKFLLNSIDI